MLTHFYTIEQITEGEEGYSCLIRLNAKHPVYEGHFPGMPVLPGVCMLHIVKGCVSEILHAPVRFAGIGNCKFLSVVNPKEEDRLLLRLSMKEGRQLRATAEADDRIVLKLKATWTEE